MDYKGLYQAWLFDDFLEEELKAELIAIKDDDKEIKERFFQPLAFGTGGMRGIMGAGINRMNRLTIEKATAGLALYLLDTFHQEAQKRGVVIAYDSRNHSAEFAKSAALVLASYGIKAYIFSELTPTPVLSYAVMHLKACAGIVITASHNPKEYNGYKVYDEHGCQLTLEPAKALMGFVEMFDTGESLPILLTEAQAKEQDLLQQLDETVLRSFEAAVLKESVFAAKEAKAALKIVYTPLHGTGLKPVSDVLAQDGFNDVHILASQREPDGNFTTVRSPNPEEKDALLLAIDYAKTIGADLVLGTDPDCDRVGIAVNNGGDFELLSGNQVGALLADFVLSQKSAVLNEKSVLIKTIVTSDLGAAIARHYHVGVLETLTGFKFIGEQMTAFAANGAHEFVMGYEESYGYLIGNHAKDKDAVVAAMLISEMAAYHKAQGRNLLTVLAGLYEQYGYYLDTVHSFTLQGLDGIKIISAIMAYMRQKGQALLGADSVKDYTLGIDGLPKSDVLKFFFAQGGWIAVRPSGTEPKIKFYFSLVGDEREKVQETLENLLAKITAVVDTARLEKELA